MKQRLSVVSVILILAILVGFRFPGQVEVEKISPEVVQQMIVQEDEFVLLDVRNPEEYEQGYIKSALLIPISELKEAAPLQLTNKDQMIVVYCQSGKRSEKATAILMKMGYTQVYDMGGINDWQYDIIE